MKVRDIRFDAEYWIGNATYGEQRVGWVSAAAVCGLGR